jgi:hypothetical protein
VRADVGRRGEQVTAGKIVVEIEADRVTRRDYHVIARSEATKQSILSF